VVLEEGTSRIFWISVLRIHFWTINSHGAPLPVVVAVWLFPSGSKPTPKKVLPGSRMLDVSTQ
jgi:hypothetical protein